MKEILAKLIERCWSDSSFKERLTSDPKAVLKELGVDLPDNVKVNIVENTRDVVNLVIPVAPNRAQSQVSLEAAAKLATYTDCCLTVSTCPTHDFHC
jgi:hypothetical protein